ncbi:MAG: fatty acid desaturase [Candidatus Caenarcaniphilales bacterium]|nr:fatty acid desaturase [Candidatus Caenarcaniphilales bacterium]
MTIWLSLTGFCLKSLDFWRETPLLNGFLQVILSFLYAGIFILAHDCMHGSFLPKHPKLNDRIGKFLLLIYACLPYNKLKAAHLTHHHSPHSESDPDFHAPGNHHFLNWYFRFLSHYLSPLPLIGMTLIANLMQHLAQITLANILFYWALPGFLSTILLFYFGTYLPHLEGESKGIQSSNLPVWLSFFACYHFGYHLEHHLYPHLPWWKLPEAKKLRKPPDELR